MIKVKYKSLDFWSIWDTLLSMLQLIYTVWYYWRSQRYARRYGSRLCAIGMYRRNCNSLKMTTIFALIGCVFPNIKMSLRDMILDSKTHAQYVAQFLFGDICYDVIFVVLFLLSAKEDIPSEKETPRRTIFYVSKPKTLEPRRPSVGLKSASQDPEPATVHKEKLNPHIKIPSVRVKKNGYNVTLYQSTWKRNHYWLRGPTVKKPTAVIQVRPWSGEEDQVETIEDGKVNVVETLLTCPRNQEPTFNQGASKKLHFSSVRFSFHGHNYHGIKSNNKQHYQESGPSFDLEPDFNAIERCDEYTFKQLHGFEQRKKKVTTLSAARLKYVM